MKKISAPKTQGVTTRARIFRAAFAFAPILSTAALGSDTEAKDFSRFEGLNLLIRDGADNYPMLGIYQNSAEIRVNNNLKFVPFHEIKQYRVVEAPVIRGRRAVLDNIDVQRAYTPANDPREKWSSSRASLSTMRSDDMELAEMQYLSMQTSASAATNLNAAINAEPNIDTQNGGTVEEKIQDELDKKLYDAVQFEFEISSPRPIPHPYVVIITDIRESEKPDSASRGIYIKQLDPIDATPAKVTILQGGFPRGFLLDKYQVHLYDGGSEIVTNLSENRVDMTRGEVFAYLDRQYLAHHKGQTISPAVIRGSSQISIRDLVDAAVLNRNIEVRVGKDGAVLDSSFGPPDPGAVPEAVRSFLRNLHFHPALENGVPVDGQVDLVLSDLTG